MIALPKRLRDIHYGWVIAGAGVLVLLSSIGLGRWSYTMILPGMQAGLGLSYARMGMIGTGNFAGYLIAVLLSPFLVRRHQPRITIVAGLLLIGFSMAIMSQCRDFLSVLLFFSLAGVGSGLANIPMMALTAPWYRSDQRGKATGIVLCGNGLGISFAGFLVPRVNHINGINGWRTDWLILGLIALVVAVTSGLLLRNHPLEMGLEPLGRVPLAAHDENHTNDEKSKSGVLLRLSLLYLAFGLTSSVFGTFIVTSMIHEYGLSESTAGFFWSWVGFCSLLSGVGLGALSDRIGRRYALAAVFTIHAIAYALAGFKLGTSGLAASVILFGLSIFGVPAIVTASLGDHFSGAKVARALSIATLFFAVGQAAGPIAAASMAGPKGIFTITYLAAALITAAAAVFALTLPAMQRNAPPVPQSAADTH